MAFLPEITETTLHYLCLMVLQQIFSTLKLDLLYSGLHLYVLIWFLSGGI